MQSVIYGLHELASKHFNIELRCYLSVWSECTNYCKGHENFTTQIAILVTQPHNAGRCIVVVSSAMQRDVSRLCVSLTQSLVHLLAQLLVQSIAQLLVQLFE